jgi:uncharacterized membrane protein
MIQHIISRIAIFVLSIVMIIFGIQHFTHPYDLVIKVPQVLPGGITWVYIAGVAFILAAISFMTNTLVRVAGYLLALMLFIFVFTIDWPDYRNTADKTYEYNALINLLKDAAIGAFALYIASNARHQRILEETEIEKETVAKEESQVMSN